MLTDHASEIATISLLKAYPDLIQRCLTDGIVPECFTQERERLYYAAVQALFLQQVTPTALSLRSKLREMKAEDPESVLLPPGEESINDFVFYAKRVLDHHIARQSIKITSNFQEKVEGNPLRVRSEIPALTGNLISLSGRGDAQDPRPSAILAEWEGRPHKGILSGLPSLDLVTEGFIPGTLHTIAAPSSHGKSLLAGHFARQAILSDAPAIYFSTEMSRASVIHRMVSALADISWQEAQYGGCDMDRDDRRAEALALLEKNFRVYDSVFNAMGMANRLRWHKSEFGQVPICVIDHLHEMTGVKEDGDFSRSERIDVAIHDAVDILHKMAVREETSCILCAQLSVESTREVKARGDVATLTAKNSGDVLNLSDYAYLLYRNPKLPNRSVLILKKDRIQGAEMRLDLDIFPETYSIAEVS